MRTNQAKLTPFNYEGGKLVTDRLHEILGTKTIRELGERLEVSASTIATWHKRGLCPFEIVLRTHMHTGVDLKWLTMGVGEPYPNKKGQANTSNVCAVQTFGLTNGKLVNKESLNFDRTLLNDLHIQNPMAISNTESIVLIDKEVKQAVSGTYLIDMDGLLSLNQIQRLPGKKLAIAFNDSTLTVDELEVKVVGHVTATLTKK